MTLTQDKARNLEDVGRQIRKLLQLAEDARGNEHQAAAAASKAQELLAKYDLSLESIEDLKSDPRTSIRRAAETSVSITEGKPEGWMEDLFRHVAATSDCHAFFTVTYDEGLKTRKGYRRVRHWKLLGFGHDLELASYTFAFLKREVTRLAQEYADQMWREIREIERAEGITHQRAEQQFVFMTGRHPLKAKLHFTKGAVTAICTKLWEAKRERERVANTNPYAIVRNKEDAIREFMDIERYGSKERADAVMAELRQKYEERDQIVPKSETPQERAKREAREKKEQARWQRKHDRAAAKEWANRDHAAYREGYRRGEEVAVTKAIDDGDYTEPKALTS